MAAVAGAPDGRLGAGDPMRSGRWFGVVLLCLLLIARLSDVGQARNYGQIPLTLALFVLPLLYAYGPTRPLLDRHRWLALAVQAMLTWVPFALFGGNWQLGIGALLGGLVLRGWSFKVLGEYFTHTVMVSSDQPVVATGPYRVLRHPSYTGIILIATGIGLAAANWADLAGLLLITLPPLLWRIHVEENALKATVGDRYRTYAASHKRLVPLVW